ncbi:copper resistance system multicopper oxidase [Thermomonas sp. XSG]|uniref:copper resistance system multicopper oxidase n=1 Tax=Thermomonas sp. XSG TaxID=2771436 RepID=UPI00168196DB|nr:copper resistance system multicopper oxidase [Thermomonas sp. XSG]QNU14827.1 copper resistance system multicopper oxidase [Thermomonas sp. XSG]
MSLFPSGSGGGLPSPSRRRFIQGLAAAGAVSTLGLWPKPGWALRSPGQPEVLAGTEFDLRVGETLVNYTGRTRPAVTINGSLPGPILRWKEGTTVALRVRNELPRGSIHGPDTSVHWHGILLPANMDGVPGMSFDGIRPGESYLYRFQVRQSGTYWYHSHSGFQEQGGMYGPLIIDPIEPEPFAFDRDYVVFLSDWTDMDPARLFARLKKMSSHDNYHQRTVGDFLRDVEREGARATLADRGAWGRMRMTPTDLSDVNAHTYTYLLNGTTALGNWTGLFKPGEKVRLRFINGSAMTYFDVRIPGLEMTVVAVDGQYVHPLTVDELRLAAAETFDVIVEPRGQEAYTIFAQDSARTGWMSATLAVREGLRAPVPALDPRPLLGMADMGHGGMDGMAHAHGAPAGGSGHGGHDMQGMDHGGAGMQAHPASETGNPLVDMQTMMPAPRLSDPGIGLRDNGRKVATYADLRSTFQDPDGREPGRTIELHLTGHMEKFAWSFDGLKFAQAEPLRLAYGERVRIELVNDTMMSHPIHLHGLWSDLEDEQGNFHLRKHTIDMPPGTKRSYRVRADALGRWAYHCHLFFHMESGMFREVRVEEGA